MELAQINNFKTLITKFIEDYRNNGDTYITAYKHDIDLLLNLHPIGYIDTLILELKTECITSSKCHLSKLWANGGFLPYNEIKADLVDKCYSLFERSISWEELNFNKGYLKEMRTLDYLLNETITVWLPSFLLNLSKFEYLSAIKSNIPKQQQQDNNLSAAEIAIKHIYLVKGGIEQYINGSQVGKKYKALKTAKNIETAFNNFENNRSNPNKVQLTNVLNSLANYPIIQNAIRNDIDHMS